jgi:hypothetical protein
MKLPKILREFALDSAVRKQTRPLYERLLQSDDIAFRHVIEDLRAKRRAMPKSELEGMLTEVILAHFQELGDSKGPKLHEKRILKLIAEFCIEDPQLRSSFLSRGAMLTNLQRRAHFVFVSLVSDLVETGKFDDLITNEISWWQGEGITKYATLYDRAVEAAFTGRLNECVDDDYSWAIVDFHGSGGVPPHLFGELFRNPRAWKLPGVPTLVENVVSSLGLCRDVSELRGKLMALGHFASLPDNSGEVARLNLVGRMIDAEARWRAQSFVLKGTLISAFSLFAWTDRIKCDFQKRGWKTAQFGQNQRAVVPATFTETSNAYEDFISEPLEVPSGAGSDDFVDGLKRLSSQNVPKQSSEIAAALGAGRAPAIAKYAHELLARFPFGEYVRMQITSELASIPLLGPPQVPADTAESAALSAILETVGIPESGEVLKAAVPVVTAGDPSLRLRRCPEAHLSDAGFRAFAAMDKMEFYRLSREQQIQLRSKLFRSS